MKDSEAKKLIQRILANFISDIRVVDLIPYVSLKGEDVQQVLDLLDRAEIKVVWPHGR